MTEKTNVLILGGLPGKQWLTQPYARQLVALARAGKLPRHGVIEVRHDSDCGVYFRLPCNCAPDLLYDGERLSKG